MRGRYPIGENLSICNQDGANCTTTDLEDNLDVRRLNEVTEKDRDRLNRYLAAYSLHS